jgi:single-stranded DNA-binding protein
MLNIHTIVGTVSDAPQQRQAGNSQVVSFKINTWEINAKTNQRYDAYHTVDVFFQNLMPVALSLQAGQLVAVSGSNVTRKTEQGGYFSSIKANTLTPMGQRQPTQHPNQQQYNQNQNGQDGQQQGGGQQQAQSQQNRQQQQQGGQQQGGQQYQGGGNQGGGGGNQGGGNQQNWS